MFSTPNRCCLYLGLLKHFTGTLGVIIFCLYKVSRWMPSITLCFELNILLSCLLFLLVKIEFVVNVYYCIPLKAVII